jgi:hypothetical protein
MLNPYKFVDLDEEDEVEKSVIGMCLAPLWIHENLPRIDLDQKN